MEDYLEYMSLEGTWADAIVIRAAAMLYRRIIHVYNSPDSSPVLYHPELVNKQGDNTRQEKDVEAISLAFVNVNFGHGSHCGGTQDHFVSLVQR